MFPEIDWVSAIGYQKEAVHVGALRYLLDRDAPTSLSVARELTHDETILSTGEPELEVKLRNDSRRPIDLAADLKFAGEARGKLGLELKVDSAWSRDQLRQTIADGQHAVLLALGLTALAVEDSELLELRSPAQGYPWRCVRPSEFATIIQNHADGDRQLLAYAEHLRTEGAAHDEARDAAKAGSELPEDYEHRDVRGLMHWAYFSEVLRDLLALRPEDEWHRKTYLSGPLVTLFITEDRAKRTGDYLEFMGEGRNRSLCVKTFGPTELLLERCLRLRELTDPIQRDIQRAPLRRPSARAKTCTVARFELADRLPGQAADLVRQLRDLISR